MSRNQLIQEFFNLLDTLGANYNKSELIESDYSEKQINEAIQGLIFIMKSEKKKHKLMITVLKSGEFIELITKKHY